MGNFLGMLWKAVASLRLGNVIYVISVALNPFSPKKRRPAGSRYLRYTRDFLKGEDIEVGEFTYGTPKVYRFPGRKLKIGKFCAIASEVVITLGENHRTDWISTYPFMVFPDDWAEAKDIKGHPSSKGDVIIGNDVWIGYGAFILSGVRIGDGASVGARAVVTSDVEPYSIVAGNPAKLVRKRFDEQTISKLLETKWWDWPIEKIHKNVGVLCNDDVPRLIQIR